MGDFSMVKILLRENEIQGKPKDLFHNRLPPHDSFLETTESIWCENVTLQSYLKKLL